MRLQGMDQKSFFLDTIDREAIKVGPTPTIKTTSLVMALRQKLPKPFLSSLFLEVEISGMGKTRRGAGVGVGDQWVKPGDGNWEIT